MTTILRRKGYDISLIKKRNGWKPDSTVIKHYEAVCNEDVYDEERRINGSNINNKRKAPITKPCPFCYTLNQMTATKCSQCGEIIDIKEREKRFMLDQKQIKLH